MSSIKVLTIVKFIMGLAPVCGVSRATLVGPHDVSLKGTDNSAVQCTCITLIGLDVPRMEPHFAPFPSYCKF